MCRQRLMSIDTHHSKTQNESWVPFSVSSSVHSHSAQVQRQEISLKREENHQRYAMVLTGDCQSCVKPMTEDWMINKSFCNPSATHHQPGCPALLPTVRTGTLAVDEMTCSTSAFCRVQRDGLAFCEYHASSQNVSQRALCKEFCHVKLISTCTHSC